MARLQARAQPPWPAWRLVVQPVDLTLGLAGRGLPRCNVCQRLARRDSLQFGEPRLEFGKLGLVQFVADRKPDRNGSTFRPFR